MSDETPRPPAGIGDLSAGTFELVARALRVAYYDWWAGSDEINMSPALAELFGFDASSWSVSRQRSLIHPDDWPIVDASLRGYFKSRDERHELSYRVMSPDGAYRWWFARNVVERDADGRVVRLIGAVTDITEARAREAENRALIARQAASIEVLKTISASPDDPQPVFDLIARHARALCGAVQVSVTEYDGALLHMRARDGWDGGAALNYAAQHWPQPAGANSLAGRAVLSGRVEHIRDVTQDAGYGGSAVELALALGTRSAMGVPLLRDGRAIGAIVLRRTEVGGFDDGEVALVESFAEQAVIAIASATSRRELRARTAELAERNTAYAEQIDHQAATIDVLQAMSASPGDPQPVFELIARRARELCNGSGVGIFTFDGELLHFATSIGSESYASPEARAAYRAMYPMRLSQESILHRAILDRRMIHVRDIAAEPGVSQAVRNIGHKSQLSLPLMHDGNPVGVITLNNAQAGGFSDTQVDLLETFAEQSVIAIRSAETFRALEARTTELAVQVAHQEATIDVLKVMSSSTNDTQPVFDIILSRAIALSGAKTGGIFGLEAGLLHPWAMLGFDPEAAVAFRKNFPLAPSERGVMSRAILRRQTLYARDYHAENPNAPQYTRDLGYNSLVAVPLLREGAAIGVPRCSIRPPRHSAPSISHCSKPSPNRRSSPSARSPHSVSCRNVPPSSNSPWSIRPRRSTC